MSAAFVLDRLTRASLEGAVFVVVVALICRLVPSLRARHRAALWWLAGAKLMLALIPHQPLELPLLPAPAVASGSATAPLEFSVALPGVPVNMDIESPQTTLQPRWAVGLWAAIVVLLSGLSVSGALHARLLRRSGRPIDDPDLTRCAQEAARRLGMSRAPSILFVPGLGSPLAAGLIRPSVLIPADAAAKLSPREMEMAIEHELAHIARRDLWLGLVPAATRRIFFFHPLAWWAEREYAIAREAACDEAVVTRDEADAFVYGRLLVRLAAGRPAATAALSPRSMLRRRLEMIESTVRRKPLRARVAWVLLAIAAVGFVPMRLVARDEAPPAPHAPEATPAPSTRPAPEAHASPEAPPAPPARAGTPAPSMPPAPEAALPRTPRAGVPAPITPPTAETPAPMATPPPARMRTPVAPPPPPTPEAAASEPVASRAMLLAAMEDRARAEAVYARSATPPARSIDLGRCLDLGRDQGNAYVITNGEGHTMCGDMRDVRAAERARRGGEDIVWFRVDGQEWVLRNRAAVEQAQSLFDAQHRVGEQSGKLGSLQAELGGRQAELGQQQAKMGMAQADMARSLAGADRNLDLETRMRDLSERMSELGRQMQVLGQQQSELGDEQQRLSEEMMRQGAEAQRGLSRLLQEAMQAGVAVRAE